MKFNIVLLITIMAVSCGKLNDKAKEAIDSVSSVNTEESGSLIAYNNAMIDYMISTGDRIDAAANDYETMRAMVSQKRKERMFIGLAFIASVQDIERENDGIFLLKPGNNLPSEIKEDLVASVKATSESFENTKNAYADFKKYLDLEDYKDDDWAKGKEYVDIIEKNIISFYDHKSEAYKIIKPLAVAAEIELLKDHPLREAYIASKIDLLLTEEILNIVYAEKIDMVALNAKYDELEANAKKHKSLIADLLKEHDKDSTYNSYYEQLEDFLGELRKHKRDGKITESEVNDISREYKYLLGDFNRFV
ncbi:MAG TPA: hypothetical protein DDZ39_12430 [Flavobacteriaceae bacterium]|nr:hypothetical protein [Flavobacteriaceae bacterium]HBS12867.1 hypothetical protein [Flavobacteriaceae bacterium]